MKESPSVVVRRAIDAPLETVWNIATDIKSSPETMSAISSVDMLEGGEEFGAGTRWRETRAMVRREATEEMYVSAVDHHRSYTVEADNAGVHYISTYTFTPVNPNTTDVTLAFTGQPTGPQNIVVRMMGKLGLRVVRKSLEKDLEDLATAAEDAAALDNPT